MINLIKKDILNVHNALCSLTTPHGNKISPDILDFMKDFAGKSIVIIMKPSHGRNIASTNTPKSHI
jgi:hypothetical protein